MFPIKTLPGPFPSVPCRCHTCPGSHMPHQPLTNCSLADGGAAMGLQEERQGSVCSWVVHGSRGRRRRAGTPANCPSAEGTRPSHPHSPSWSSAVSPSWAAQSAFTWYTCLKAVGNCVSVLGRWRPWFLPGRWCWFVLVADGQSALRAKAENQSSEGTEIYCGRKLKTDASAFGVTPVLPSSVGGG